MLLRVEQAKTVAKQRLALTSSDLSGSCSWCYVSVADGPFCGGVVGCGVLTKDHGVQGRTCGNTGAGG